MLVIVIMLFAVLSVVSYKVFDDLNTDIQADDDVSPAAKAKVEDLHSRFPGTFDAGLVTIFGLLFLAGIIASLVVDSHPAFLIVILILMAFISLAAGFLSNTWEEFMADGELSVFEDSFPMTDWLLDNFMLIVGVTTLVFGGIVFFKQRTG